MTPVIGALYVYPVKSAAGIECDTIELGPHGLLHDREWLIVDPNGRFLTQREEGRLALLRTAIADKHLHMTRPDGAVASVPLGHEGAQVEVQVWKSRCRAFDAGEPLAKFLSEWLERPLRLVRFDISQLRMSDPAWTEGREVSTLFSDGYPLLVLSRASIADLSGRVGQELPVERFRPNVLLDGVAPYAEDAATHLLSGEVRLALTKACTRCVITTIDHENGQRTGEEPLRTLRAYRFDPQLRGVVFGRNAYAETGVGRKLVRGAPASIIAR